MKASKPKVLNKIANIRLMSPMDKEGDLFCLLPIKDVLIINVSDETLTTRRMIPSKTNIPPAEVSKHKQVIYVPIRRYGDIFFLDHFIQKPCYIITLCSPGELLLYFMQISYIIHSFHWSSGIC
jgi:hypothetical protein